MGRDEVLKIMARQIMERPGVLDRFLREIRAVARLRHPNIVTAYSAFRLGESIVFAMEYVEGLDLARMVKAKGPLPVAHACNFVYQAALGLQHAHEEGLVHRDIKPANLMLARKGERPVIKILDFGLAKAAREEKVDAGLTMEGQALGTPDYIAPEQIIDATSADIRADIYSLGGTLYYLLSGHAPFHAKSLYDLYQAHISRDADPLNQVRPDVPAELAALVAKLMAKDPSRRFQTPGDVAQALTPFFKKGSVSLEIPAAVPAAPPSDSVSGARTEQTAEPALGGTIEVPVRRPWKLPAPGPVWVILGTSLFVLGVLAAGLAGLWKLRTGDGVAVVRQSKASTVRPGPAVAVNTKKQDEAAARALAVVPAAGNIAVAPGRGQQGTPGAAEKTPDPKPARVEVTSVPLTQTGGVADGFVPLFNGRDFEGWTLDADLLTRWEVREGTIHSTSSGRITSARGDYGDFHLRAEFRAVEGFLGHLFFRSSNLPGLLDAYGVWITTAPVPTEVTTVQDHSARARTGSLITLTREPPSSLLVSVVDSERIRPNEWFTLELIATGPHFTVRIDGNAVLEVYDPDQTYKQGHIALDRLAGTPGAIECRKFEIKELQRGDSGAAPARISHSGWMLRSGFPLPDRACSWSYTLNDPRLSWTSPGFDDSAWMHGQAPFGTPGPAVKTGWATPDIWLRRRFLMPALPDDLNLFLYVRHDDTDVAIFVNGKPLYNAPGGIGFYTGFALTPAQRSLFRAGSNTIAVHGHNATAEQVIDVGLRLVPASMEVVEARAGAAANAAPAVMHDGAFAFPQSQSKDLWNEPGLRVSVWNDSQFVYVQALVRLDDDVASGRSAAGTDIDAAYLVLDVDSDNRFTEWRDRVYGLAPTLSYQICFGKGEWSTIRDDSKGRGTMRMLPDGKGGWIRVDSFAIPLAEIERKPGETIRAAYWGDSARLKSPVNANGIRRQDHYRFSDLPFSRFQIVLLSHRPAILDVSKVPDDR
jgi:hypothetical protein